MANLNLTKHGLEFFTIDGIRAAVESSASSPKVAAGVAASTASMGALAKMEVIQSWIGTFSLLVGAMTGCVVLSIQLIKLIRVYRHFNPNSIEPKGDL